MKRIPPYAYKPLYGDEESESEVGEQARKEQVREMQS